MERIAVIGSGPRGLSVVERIATRLHAEPEDTREMEIHLIDAAQIGCGRVWRTDQPDWFIMNTASGQVSSFSGESRDGKARAGAGPSLAEWWQDADPFHCAGPGVCAPRAVFGRYLQHMLRTVKENLPRTVTLHSTHGEVVDLEPLGRSYRLTFRDGTCLTADQVVIATGHSTPEPAGDGATLADFAACNPGLRFIGSDSPADMPLKEIAAGSYVGVIGLGLTFFDIMAALTIGRGGSFHPNKRGGLDYHASGDEPLLVAGSRSAMPFLARPRIQEFDSRYYHRPELFTLERVRADRPPGEPLDFAADVQPWLFAEAGLVYYSTAIRRRYGDVVSAKFTEEVMATADVRCPEVAEVAARFDIADLPPFNFKKLANPFLNRNYPNPAAFNHKLLDSVSADLKEAEAGNIDSPIKAALGVLVSGRVLGTIRRLVDFAGLTPASHRYDFLGGYSPQSIRLGGGPPRERLHQLHALLRSGHVTIVGPDARYEPDPTNGRFRVSSPRVHASATPVTTVIDARIPRADLYSDPSPLTRRLIARGIVTSFVNGEGADAFDTGGVHITDGSFHPVNRNGIPDTGLYILGIPTEHTRWLTTLGSSRPGFWTEFIYDADAVARHLLEAGD